MSVRRGKVTINRRGEMTADERRLDNLKKKRRVKNQRARLRSDAGRLANENRELRAALAELLGAAAEATSWEEARLDAACAVAEKVLAG